jgi:hypothetical protein
MFQDTNTENPRPDSNNLDFLYGLGKQYSNESLLNYIANKFNTIENSSIRKLVVYDWIQSINWMLNESNKNYDYIHCFGQRHFVDDLDGYDFNNLRKTLSYLNSLTTFEDINLLENGYFNDVKIPEIIIQDEVAKKNKDDFFSFSIGEQQDILNIYQWYREKEKDITAISYFEDEVIESTLDSMVREKLSNDFNSDENIEFVTSICMNYVNSKSRDNLTKPSDEEIVNALEREIFINNNLTVTAYYLHYILLSFGVNAEAYPAFKDIKKFTGKQATLIQRLLCAVTTKKKESIEQKSNSYYKTVNELFKIDYQDKWQVKNLVKNLNLAKELLLTNGFVEAVELLEMDSEKILRTE